MTNEDDPYGDVKWARTLLRKMEKKFGLHTDDETIIAWMDEEIEKRRRSDSRWKHLYYN